ncbi:MAG: PQQ-like beta-propeller repeat protein [Candidatus Omnitrophica bacterium]|nr:PQQ-like beta-propeller repeat protein [Candidatus Omnitrophota bacterium]
MLSKRKKTLIFFLLPILILILFGKIYIYDTHRKFMDINWLHSANPNEQRITAHRTIQSPLGNLHDAFITLMRVGDETSVPYLIGALKWGPNSNKGDSVVCTWAHCREALYKITNFDFGYKYKDWAEWWKKYKNTDRKKWLWDGFVLRGYELDEENDNKTITFLIKAASGTFPYSVENACFLLNSLFKKPIIVKALRKTAKSPEKEMRVGTVHILYQMNFMDKLRDFYLDSDRGVRELARSKLNDLLSQELISDNFKVPIKESTGSYNSKIKINEAKQILYIGCYHKNLSKKYKLAAFSLKENKILWTFPCKKWVSSIPLAEGGKIYFVSGNKYVYCITEATRELVWICQIKDNPMYAYDNKVIVKNKNVYFSDHENFYCVDKNTGNLNWKLNINPKTDAFCSNDESLIVLTSSEELLAISFDGKILAREEIGFSPGGIAVNKKNVYFFTRENKTGYAYLNASDSKTFKLKWRTKIGKIWNWSNAAPLIYSNELFVCSDNFIVALSLDNGEIIWEIKDEADSEIKIYNENLLIMRSRGCRITFRDITTGEIIKILDKPRLHETPFVNKQYLVCSDTDGNLWIIDPLIKKRRKGVN